MAQQERYYFSNQEGAKRLISAWDVLVLLLITGLFFVLSWAAKEMTTPYHLGSTPKISLDSAMLPAYALRTVLRMFIALIISLVFTFIFGTWAAKSRRA